MRRENLDERLGALELRLARVEALLESVSEKLEQAQVNADAAREAIKRWVTDYVSLRLNQLVPETCEHVPDAAATEGPVLPGTRIRCTDEVVHRLGRIPIPFVRQMVTQKVAEAARAEGVVLVDVPFFERAATF
jgi:uncharacterized coiled-coil protein SlyX